MVSERFADLMKLLEKIKNKEFFRQYRTFNLPTRQILEIYLKQISKHFDEEVNKSVFKDFKEFLFAYA